jgi:exopolyphosphatase/guanosine-5'-triphosphate,3'-diphosphate pyrophosphatase
MPTFAAVDIGANSVRLKVARLVRNRLKVIEEDRQVTRLGESVFRSGGLLSPEAMEETIKALRRFHRTAQRHGTDSVKAVATSALRDARNRQAFVEWVHSATGWRLDVITGEDEARLIHLGLVSNMRITQWPVLMMDLGGGSCELTISARRHITQINSLPLGAVRLTNDFLHHDPPRKYELEQLRGFIDRELGRVASRIAAARVKGMIATSGTAAALAAVAANLYKHPTLSTVSRSEAIRIARQLAKKNVQQRTSYQGIGPRRAEIIVAGTQVFARLMERCNLRMFRYSPLGLRDGLLAQMAADYDRSTRSRKQIESDRWDALLAATDHYRVDRDYALKIRELAMQLFNGLKSVHRLPPEYREWLSAAAMLYEVGAYINRNGRHRHAYYIISHSEILGYTPEERRLIAGIARYQGKSRPNPTDPPIQAVPLAERENVAKASVLLRLARALNLGRGGAVRMVRAHQRDSRVSLKLAPTRGSEVDLELWAIDKERSYFREVFGRELSAAAA